jgi:peptidoglycan/xylan/chitin deacetylase (PgdA/CDA1 family)
LRGALVLTYHALERNGGPLATPPAQLSAQLDVLLGAGAVPLTVAQLATAISTRTVPSSAFAITFDDAFESIGEHAGLLLDRGVPATIFCVAGHLGGRSDWATRKPKAWTAPLLDAAQLGELAALGFEIGAHGVSHAPLDVGDEPFFRREIVEAKTQLEQTVGSEIRSFALPYGARPSPAADSLLRGSYEAVCTTRVGLVNAHSDPYELPRVDAHYLRSESVLRTVVHGRGTAYLTARRLGSRGRRLVVKDYARRAQQVIA